jgi:TetR/AcrR family transcriptional regulator, cholesterol catabolism regulator
MSRIADPALEAPPRQVLTDRQADTVARLVAAAVDELRANGYDGMSVRNVARRAGVAPATAYTYFASKDHLVADVFWRRLVALDRTEIDPASAPGRRVATALAQPSLLVADEPELASACTVALLSEEPNVARLRDAIGNEITERLRDALGDDGSAAVLRTLNLVFSGALVHAGTGNLRYEDLPARIEEATNVIFGVSP